MISKFFGRFNSYGFSEAEFHEIFSRLKEAKFQKSTLILAPGKVCSQIYFLLSGVVRGFYRYSNGDEKTLFVSGPGEFFNVMKSFNSRQPSEIGIDALQDCTVMQMSYDDLQHLYNNVPGFNKAGREFVEEYMIRKFDDMMVLQCIATPLQRYEAFIASHEAIIEYLPQHMIADMINVSPVHLSRIKSGYAKKMMQK